MDLEVKQLARGRFVCPHCTQMTTYLHKRVSRGSALLAEHVECLECFCTFVPGVLEDDSGVAPLHLQAALRTMALMMIADGVIAPSEVERIAIAYQRVGGAKLTEDQIRAAGASAGRVDLQDFLRSMAGQLNDQGKLAVVRSAFTVAAADGVFQDEEKALMRSLAEALSVENPIEAPGARPS